MNVDSASLKFFFKLRNIFYANYDQDISWKIRPLNTSSIFRLYHSATCQIKRKENEINIYKFPSNVVPTMLQLLYKSAENRLHLKKLNIFKTEHILYSNFMKLLRPNTLCIFLKKKLRNDRKKHIWNV